VQGALTSKISAHYVLRINLLQNFYTSAMPWETANVLENYNFCLCVYGRERDGWIGIGRHWPSPTPQVKKFKNQIDCSNL